MSTLGQPGLRCLREYRHSSRLSSKAPTKIPLVWSAIYVCGTPKSMKMRVDEYKTLYCTQVRFQLLLRLALLLLLPWALAD